MPEKDLLVLFFEEKETSTHKLLACEMEKKKKRKGRQQNGACFHTLFNWLECSLKEKNELPDVIFAQDLIFETK